MRYATALICVALAALILVTVATTATPKPWLGAVRAAPLMLQGTAFVPGEHVRLTLRVGKLQFVRVATANASGSFRTGFGLAVVDPCRGTVVVTATGSRGSVSTYKRACRPGSTAPPLRVS